MMTNYLRYSNQNATRNRPLDEDLVRRLAYLEEMGITAEVYSGGQDGIGEGSRRTGSTRHDHGGAGDMRFFQGDRQLNWASEADRPIFQDIVRRGKSAGITGFGAGPGYMSEGTMHVGMGDAGVWGAGGKSANAPDWLRSSYYGDGAGTAYAEATPTVRDNPRVLDEVMAAGNPSGNGALASSTQVAAAAPMPVKEPTEFSKGLTKIGHELGFTGSGKEGDPTKFMGIDLGGDDGLVADLAGISKAFAKEDEAMAAPVAAPRQTASTEVHMSFEPTHSSILEQRRRRRGGLGGLGGFLI